jgi:hypothetical protein
MAEKKSTFIVSSVHAMIGNIGGPSDVVTPGQRVPFNENSDSHKYLREQIEAGNPDYDHLSIEEVSLKDEKAADEEKQEMLAKAEEIAAKQRDEELQEAADTQAEVDAQRAQAEEDGQTTQAQATDFPPSDQEAQRLAVQSGAAQRATTQADVADEDQPKSGRRSGSSKKS